MKIEMEEHLESLQDAENKYKELEAEYSYLQEDHEDLKKEYADFRLRNNRYISSLKGVLEETIKEDQKIKKDCKIITVLSFVLVILVIVLMIL